MATLRAKFVAAAKRQLRKHNSGVAAAIRCATTFTPGCTLAEMVAAGQALGFNPVTVRRQFAQARKEDAEVEAYSKGMTDEQFVDAVVRTINRS